MASPQDPSYWQSNSPFFGRLPPEIRHQIYGALLEIAGPTQHIYKSATGDGSPVTHTRCVIDPDARDVREVEYYRTFSEEAETAAGSREQNLYGQKVWRGRQYTDWCNHWQCEEGDGDGEGGEGEGFSAFLGPMLACKRMRDDFGDLMYSSVTFSFVNTPALHRFLRTTAPRYLGLIRSIQVTWCASPPDDEELGHDSPDEEDPLGCRDAVDSIGNWTSLWFRLAGLAPRLNRVRIWIYGRFPRFPMPGPEYFQVLDDFANGALAAGGAEKVPRVMEQFTVQTIWTREFDSMTVDGVEVPEDDGEVVPDWLRGRRFEVSRVPAVEYEPEVWMAMWAGPRAEDTAGQVLGAILKGKGWGIRGRRFRNEDGKAGFART